MNQEIKDRYSKLRHEPFPDYAEKIPEIALYTLLDYVEFGLEPGDFMEAFLSNDLFDALARADKEMLPVFKELDSILFYPVYAFIHKYVKYKSVASLLTLIIILIMLFGPFSYLSYLITQEVMSLVGNIESGSFDSLKTFFQHPAANTLIKKVLLIFHITELEFQKALVENVAKIGQDLAGFIKIGLGNIVSGTINFVFMILSTFFFLGDGPEFIDKISNFMPFSKKQKDKLLQQTKDIIVSTMYGGVTVAAAQGIIGGILFAVLGIPSPVPWG